MSLRSQLRIVVTEETAQLWFFSCVHVPGKGLSLSFGHSGMINLGRQVEHMAAPPMAGGLLMGRRVNGTGAKSFCLLTSGFSTWSPENFGHRSKVVNDHLTPTNFKKSQVSKIMCIFGLWPPKLAIFCVFLSTTQYNGVGE